METSLPSYVFHLSNPMNAQVFFSHNGILFINELKNSNGHQRLQQKTKNKQKPHTTQPNKIKNLKQIWAIIV